MKTKILLLMLAIATGMSAQISLEHTYTGTGSSHNNFPETFAFFTDSGLHYYVINDNVVNIYDGNHNLTTSVTIPLQSGYEITAGFLFTDHLFNSDDNIEFVLTTYNSSTHIYNMSLYDENGSVLFDFGNEWEPYVIKVDDTTYKLLVIATDAPNSYKIYSLPGTMTAVQQYTYNRRIIGYPVPTNNRLHISNALGDGERSVLYIYNLAGQMLMQKEVEGSNINVDVSGLPGGNYIYKIGGYTGKFIKK